MIPHPTFDGVVYRACSMEYYRAAYGGKGSRLMAGRFNAKGEVALYVALDVQTAYAEFQRGGIGRPQPCSVIAARLRIRNLIDLTGDLGSCHADLQSWRDDWEDARDAFNAGDRTATCASWRCKSHATNARRSGFVYPSLLNVGGRNMVIYTEDATAGDCLIEVIDDDGVIGKAASGVV